MSCTCTQTFCGTGGAQSVVTPSHLNRVWQQYNEMQLNTKFGSEIAPYQSKLFGHTVNKKSAFQAS